MPAYFCSVRFHTSAPAPDGGVYPHVPRHPPPTRYTVLRVCQGSHSLRVVAPVEEAEPGCWRVWLREEWVTVDDSHVWDSPDAAIEAEFEGLEKA